MTDTCYICGKPITRCHYVIMHRMINDGEMDKARIFCPKCSVDVVVVVSMMRKHAISFTAGRDDDEVH